MICRSPPPPKILGEKPKVTTKPPIIFHSIKNLMCVWCVCECVCQIIANTRHQSTFKIEDEKYLFLENQGNVTVHYIVFIAGQQNGG